MSQSSTEQQQNKSVVGALIHFREHHNLAMRPETLDSAFSTPVPRVNKLESSLTATEDSSSSVSLSSHPRWLIGPKMHRENSTGQTEKLQYPLDN